MTTRNFTARLSTAIEAIYPATEAVAIATLVTEHLLGLDALQRRMQAMVLVPAAIEAQLPGLIKRLLAYEPVQYVLGMAHFDGMELEVTPATLIPRPETEELLQLILKEQPARLGLRILDVGTGSGCLALALARARPAAEVWAVDISAEALAVAQRNGAKYAPQVHFQQVDILQELPTGITPGSLDVLVSNPPYVRESERAQMRDNVLAWEPATALFVPDDDPLLFYRRLAEVGQALLRPSGGLYLEINEALGNETVALLEEAGYADVKAMPDMFDWMRMVRGAKP